MKVIFDSMWQFLNMDFDFGDVTFKYVYLFYLSVSMFLLKLFLGGKKNV